MNVFKSLIYGSWGKIAYPIFEEISAPSYKWTALHYAMHYAKWDIIKFIFEYLYQNDLVNISLNMKTKDGRCPLLCLLKSIELSNKTKLEMFDKIVSTFSIPISDDVRIRLEELKNYENKGKQNYNKNKNPDPYPECPYITDY